MLSTKLNESRIIQGLFLIRYLVHVQSTYNFQCCKNVIFFQLNFEIKNSHKHLRGFSLAAYFYILY